MKKLNENLSEILDVEPLEIIEETPSTDLVVSEQNSSDDTVESDTEFARQNIKNLISKGNDAINKLITVATESERARDYEVVSTMIKNLSELNKDLLEIQKRKKDLKPQEFNKQNINVDKAVFVGSTAELLKLIKSNKES